MTKRRWLVLLLLGAVALVLAGCSFQRQRSFPVLSDWSLGAVVGTASLRQPVGLAVDEEGAYLMWSTREPEGTRLRFVHLTPQGSQAVSRTLEVRTFFPTLPQLVATDRVHGFVITRLESGERNGVYHLQLNREGELLVPPRRLSDAQQLSEHLSVAPAPDGSIDLLWDVVEGSAEGVYHLKLDADGEPEGFPQLLAPRGIQPTGQVDRNGMLHAAWFEQIAPERFHLQYATIEAGARASDEPLTIAIARIPVSDVVLPPTLGLDDSHVYVLWSQEHRTGLQQGASELMLVTFTLAEPSQSDPSVVYVSLESSPQYTATEAFPPLTTIALPNDQVAWTDFIEGPSVVQGQQTSHLKVLADMQMSFRFDDRPQIVLLLFQDGKLAGYQLPVRTRQYSQRPRGTVNGDGELHMTWIDLEEPGSYSIYYASTAPEVQETLNQIPSNDRVMNAIDLLWGMASGFTFVPLVGVVAIPVLLILGIFYLTGNDDSLRTSWAAQLTLGVAIVVYLGAKMLILAGLITRPPLLSLVPAAIQPYWWLLVLLLVAAIAGLTLWVYIRRNERPYLFRGMITFLLVDALLTLLVYGPTFYSE